MNDKTMEKCLVEIAYRIKKYRINNAIEQKVMAEKLGISEEEYQKIENGEQWIKLDILIRLEKEFHINCRYLLLGEETMYSAYLETLIKSSSKDKIEILDNIFKHLINILNQK